MTSLLTSFCFFVIITVFFHAPEVPIPALSEVGADQTVRFAEQCTQEFRAQLQTLADNGNSPEIKAVFTELFPEKSLDKLYIPCFPKKRVTGRTSEETTAATATTAEMECWKLRQKYAQQLYDAAKTAAKQGRATLAVNLCISALRINPDFLPVRTMLGYRLVGDEWMTAWEYGKIKANFVNHPQFGWIQKSQVAQFEAGKRPATGGKWVSLEDDTQKHQGILNGWNIETEHYVVRTNHSIEAAVKTARQLEDFFVAWNLLFFRYTHTEAELQGILAGRGSLLESGNVRRNGIVLFKNQADFAKNLGATLPGIRSDLAQIGIGYYSVDNGIAYFYVDVADSEEQNNVTRAVYHEAAHQLFDKYRRAAPFPLPSPPTGQNAWAFEIMPLYLETFRKEGPYYVFGGAEDIRMTGAIQRWLVQKKHLPFAEMSQMTAERFLSQPSLPSVYSQCAGIGHFLMHAEEGKYRHALVVFLQCLYSGDDTANRLCVLLRMSADGFDAEYKQYLTVIFK